MLKWCLDLDIQIKYQNYLKKRLFPAHQGIRNRMEGQWGQVPGQERGPWKVWSRTGNCSEELSCISVAGQEWNVVSRPRRGSSHTCRGLAPGKQSWSRVTASTKETRQIWEREAQGWGLTGSWTDSPDSPLLTALHQWSSEVQGRQLQTFTCEPAREAIPCQRFSALKDWGTTSLQWVYRRGISSGRKRRDRAPHPSSAAFLIDSGLPAKSAGQPHLALVLSSSDLALCSTHRPTSPCVMDYDLLPTHPCSDLRRATQISHVGLNPLLTGVGVGYLLMFLTLYHCHSIVHRFAWANTSNVSIVRLVTVCGISNMPWVDFQASTYMQRSTYMQSSCLHFFWQLHSIPLCRYTKVSLTSHLF